MNKEAEKIKELMEGLMERKEQLAGEKIKLIEDIKVFEDILKTCKRTEELRKAQTKIAKLREEREKALKELITVGKNNVKEMRDYARKLIESREDDLKELKEAEAGLEVVETELGKLEWD